MSNALLKKYRVHLLIFTPSTSPNFITSSSSLKNEQLLWITPDTVILDLNNPQFSSRFLFKWFCKRWFIFRNNFFHFYCISASLSLHFVLFLFFIPPRFNLLFLSANKTRFLLIHRETGMNKEQNTSLPKVQTSIGHFRTISSVLYEALGIWNIWATSQLIVALPNIYHEFFKEKSLLKQKNVHWWTHFLKRKRRCLFVPLVHFLCL